MQNLRLFLFATLGMLLLLAWTAWQEDYRRDPAETAERESVEEDAAPAPGAGAPDEPPEDARPAATDAESGDGPPRQAADGEARGNGPDEVRVVTDLLEITISAEGGTITHAGLRDHSVSIDDPTPFPLLHREEPMFLAENGLVMAEGDGPDHRDRWQVEQAEYRLAAGEDEIVVPLTWTGEDGLEVTKRYRFSRDSYLVDLEHEVRNEGEEARRLYQYSQLRRAEEGGGNILLGAYSYTGGVMYSPEDKYQKLSFDDMRDNDLSEDVEDGWVAMIQHYFLAAWVPQRDVDQRFYSRDQNGQFVLGMSSPYLTVEPGSSDTVGNRLYAGPKAQDRLDDIAEGLELTVDYGWFTVISKPLFVALSWIHSVVGNWGWSIILLTLGIKAVFFKLSETSYRSMARMRKLQPRMQQLKERFGDDRQRMNQELMTLYKEEKVNPLGGCLPILVQIPVFIGLYWMLLESVELRQAPWVLWINDLSTPDPFYVLPLLMGASMLIQQRLNPAPMDPIQQKVLMALPIVFTVFFLFFPAGLVLYWVTNNTLSILQQWMITRRIEAGDSPKSKTAAKRKDAGKDEEKEPEPDNVPAKAPPKAAANPANKPATKGMGKGPGKGGRRR